MLDPSSKHPDDAMPFTVRSVFLVDDKNKLRLELTYPASTGRNWTEVIRAIDSIRLADAHPIGTFHFALFCLGRVFALLSRIIQLCMVFRIIQCT